MLNYFFILLSSDPRSKSYYSATLSYFSSVIPPIQTPEEASRGFVPPSPAPKMKAVAADSVDAVYTLKIFGFANLLLKCYELQTRWFQSESSEPFCSQECEMIRVTLEKALEERKKPKHAKLRTGSFRTAAHSLGDPGPVEVDELDGAFSGANRPCSLGKTCSSHWIYPVKYANIIDNFPPPSSLTLDCTGSKIPCFPIQSR